MSELGEVLCLLHDAHQRTPALYLRITDWSQPSATPEILVDQGHGLTGGLQWAGAGPWPEPTTRSRQMWAATPDRLRVEIRRGDAIVRLGVRDGARWWRWDETLGVSSGIADSGGRARQPTLPALLDPLLLHPARFIGALRLQPVGRTSRAGRAAILVRGVPREPAASRSQLAYELEFDAEHGTVLRRTVFDSGRRFQDSQVLHVAYDSDIDSTKFTFTAPDEPNS